MPARGLFMVSRYVQPAFVTTAGVALAAFGGSVVAGAVAFATWPLLEYVTHRWLLHAPRGWASRAHRKHHKAPRDPKYLLVPFRVVFAASCVLALPAADLDPAAFAILAPLLALLSP